MMTMNGLFNFCLPGFNFIKGSSKAAINAIVAYIQSLCAMVKKTTVQQETNQRMNYIDIK